MRDKVNHFIQISTLKYQSRPSIRLPYKDPNYEKRRAQNDGYGREILHVLKPNLLQQHWALDKSRKPRCPIHIPYWVRNLNLRIR